MLADRGDWGVASVGADSDVVAMSQIRKRLRKSFGSGSRLVFVMLEATLLPRKLSSRFRFFVTFVITFYVKSGSGSVPMLVTLRQKIPVPAVPLPQHRP